MAIINDLDDLTLGSEITIDTTTKKIRLFPGTGNLTTDGIFGQALYSFLKVAWKDDPLSQGLNGLDPPFLQGAIQPEQLLFVSGWTFYSDADRYLIRSAGWREIDTGGSVTREYMGIITLPGDGIGATNTASFAFSSDTAKTDFQLPGPVNQAIQTFGDVSNGNFDKRSDSLTVFIRSQGQTYGSSTSTSIGLSALNFIANRFPVAERLDTKITASDATIASSAPYTGMSITFGAVTRTIGGVSYNYNVVVNGNSGTAEQIYEFLQYKLRQSTDIDDGAGTQVGQLADVFANFSGDTLTTTTGVYIDSFQAADRNRLVFTDTGGTGRTFPFLASGSITFNQNLVNDSDAFYKLFFTSSYDQTTAIQVNDNDGNPIGGTISGASSVSWTFAYDSNNQGGRTPGTDASVTLIAQGLNTAGYFQDKTLTIARSTGQNFSAVAPLERNFSDPT